MFSAMVPLFLSLAFADQSCLPDYPAAQVTWNIRELPIVHQQNLVTRRGEGLLETRAQIVASAQADSLNLTIAFDPSFDGVSLPYNVYAVVAVQDGQQVGLWDFTRSCKGPGVSFFPGQEIRIRDVKWIGDAPEQLQIIVWGRL